MAYTTINKPTDYFNTVLYTGTESSGNSITGVGFQPDWIWIKNRSDATNHNLYDSVRGGNGTSHYFLKSNVVNVEGTNTSSLLTIDSDGFTLGDGNEVNGTPDNIVAWNWLASNTTASNTDGSITSTVSANTTSGFSIVSYTGTGSNPSTVGHGLGTAPSMIIVKGRDQGADWFIYNKEIGNANTILLNTTDASFSGSFWNSTTPTSSVFSLGANDVNTNTSNYIAYCFAEKKGYSKFGSYTGNGSTDGAFVYTGFKPSWVMIKQSSGSGTSWNIWDNKRLGYNTKNYQIEANTTVVENTSLERLLITSNGFKCLTDNAQINGSGATYIYMAFAEHPFVSSTGTPTTAR